MFICLSTPIFYWTSLEKKTPRNIDQMQSHNLTFFLFCETLNLCVVVKDTEEDREIKNSLEIYIISDGWARYKCDTATSSEK